MDVTIRHLESYAIGRNTGPEYVEAMLLRPLERKWPFDDQFTGKIDAWMQNEAIEVSHVVALYCSINDEDAFASLNMQFLLKFVGRWERAPTAAERKRFLNYVRDDLKVTREEVLRAENPILGNHKMVKAVDHLRRGSLEKRVLLAFQRKMVQPVEQEVPPVNETPVYGEIGSKTYGDYIDAQYVLISKRIMQVLEEKTGELIADIPAFITKPQSEDLFIDIRRCLQELFEVEKKKILSGYPEALHASLFSKTKLSSWKAARNKNLRIAFHRKQVDFLQTSESVILVNAGRQKLEELLRHRLCKRVSEWTLEESQVEGGNILTNSCLSVEEDFPLALKEAKLDCYSEELSEAISPAKFRESLVKKLQVECKEIIKKEREIFLQKFTTKVIRDVYFYYLEQMTLENGQTAYDMEDLKSIKNKYQDLVRTFPEDYQCSNFSNVMDVIKKFCQITLLLRLRLSVFTNTPKHEVIEKAKELFSRFKHDVRKVAEDALIIVDQIKLRKAGTLEAEYGTAYIEETCKGRVLLCTLRNMKVVTIDGAEILPFTDDDIRDIKDQCTDFVELEEIDSNSPEMFDRVHRVIYKMLVKNKERIFVGDSPEEQTALVETAFTRFRRNYQDLHKRLYEKANRRIETMQGELFSRTLEHMVYVSRPKEDDKSFEDLRSLFLAQVLSERKHLENVEPDLSLIFTDDFILKKFEEFNDALKQELKIKRKEYLKSEQYLTQKEIVYRGVDQLEIPSDDKEFIIKAYDNQMDCFPVDDKVINNLEAWHSFQKVVIDRLLKKYKMDSVLSILESFSTEIYDLMKRDVFSPSSEMVAELD